METASELLVTLPVLLPIVKAIGMDTVQFGVIMVLLLMISMLTPQMALCLFVTSKSEEYPLIGRLRPSCPAMLP